MRFLAAFVLVVGLVGLAFSDERSESERAEADSLGGSERGVRGGRRPTRWNDEPRSPTAAGARSIGSPQDGRLLGGRRLRETPFLKILEQAAPRGRRFGTEELVGVLTRAAGGVAKKHAGSILRVADLSARGGGEVHMHASHESGRDADVAFYLQDAAGADAMPPRFVKMGPDGRSADGGLVFDAVRNWAFLEALVSDRQANVTHVFVAAHLEALLVAQARASGASPPRLARVEAILSQPRGAFPHDNHFHIRVGCAREDRPECVDVVRRATAPAVDPRRPRRPAAERGDRRARRRADRG